MWAFAVIFLQLFFRYFSYTGALLGGALVFLCAYWFYHFETWHERGISIGLTLLAVWPVMKCLPTDIDDYLIVPA